MAFKFKTLDMVRGLGAGLLAGLCGFLIGELIFLEGWTTVTGITWASILFAFGFVAVIIEGQETDK